ncbi:putative cell division protein kinase (Ctk1) [Penicillium brasilianum]|uniref:cyclin-dependent kinase n=1 Tax=Penicillium brasilianum TaxID=104259 RepID=A0A1S9RZN6_PENBI|nr:putative cell division protein kinase (Ctk1) [Penicillium brasilianum]
MDWRGDLGFTDRLRAIQSLTTVYQLSSSTTAFAEAQAEARRYETEAYDQATSKEEYDRMCQQAIDAAETKSVAPVHGSEQEQNVSQEEKQELAGSSELSVGETFGQYTSCFHHSDGLHSTIYKSTAKDGTVRAVKITVLHLMAAPHDVHREARLLREAASPHVIPLVETFNLDGDRLALVFPFLRYDFAQLLRRDMVTATQTRSILCDMFRALEYIHKLGIIHRDIKPSNILMSSADGPAKLADFGISWKEGDPGSEPSDQKITDVGTTSYRAPEVLFGYKAYGTALDLWAAGCVVAEAITVGHGELFDSGPVGSDLSLIHSIFSTLGTPDDQIWPDVEVLPDWGKVEFYTVPAQPWEDILPAVSSNGRDLARRLLRYQSSERLSADEALRHPYFSTV